MVRTSFFHLFLIKDSASTLIILYQFVCELMHVDMVRWDFNRFCTSTYIQNGLIPFAACNRDYTARNAQDFTGTVTSTFARGHTHLNSHFDSVNLTDWRFLQYFVKLRNSSAVWPGWCWSCKLRWLVRLSLFQASDFPSKLCQTHHSLVFTLLCVFGLPTLVLEMVENLINVFFHNSHDILHYVWKMFVLLLFYWSPILFYFGTKCVILLILAQVFRTQNTRTSDFGTRIHSSTES